MRTVTLCGGLLALGLVTLPVLGQSEDEKSSDEKSSGSDSAESAAPEEGSDAEAEPPKKKKKKVKAKAEPAEEEESAASAADDPTFSHAGQFGLRVGFLGGYRMVFRYDASPFCRTPDSSKPPNEQQKFCGHAAPLAMDFGLSYTAVGTVEPFLWARLGLASEMETDTSALKLVGAGVRLYTMSDSAFKIFIEPAVGLEFEGGRDPSIYPWYGFNPDYKADLIFHLAAGPHYDFSRYVGLYADMGLTVGVLRYIQGTLEVQAGVQGRVP
jgi:hypothetical protein